MSILLEVLSTIGTISVGADLEIKMLDGDSPCILRS